MSIHSADEPLLHRALELARQGIGLASPNPHVGGLITDPAGNVVGTGIYTYDGLKHAEILALETAGEKARGGTLYINLEPHAHQGRTPPCTDALIAAGIRRVVASMADPNPKVSGRGFEQLRAAGVLVEVGGLEEHARRLNEGFARYVRHGVPLVTLKSAMTLDGKIAPSPNQARQADEHGFAGLWITGAAAREHVHQLRHENDAILVGIGTILADNPLLTDRRGLPRRRPLLRVILDSGLRLPADSRMVRNLAQESRQDVLVFCATADDSRMAELEGLGVRVERVPSLENGRPDLRAALRRLGELAITSVMIEGGSRVNRAALAAGIVDKIFLYYSPQVVGGTESVPFAADEAFDPAGLGFRAQNIRLHRFAEDVAIEGYLRSPYEE